MRQSESARVNLGNQDMAKNIEDLNHKSYVLLVGGLHKDIVKTLQVDKKYSYLNTFNHKDLKLQDLSIEPVNSFSSHNSLSNNARSRITLTDSQNLDGNLQKLDSIPSLQTKNPNPEEEGKINANAEFATQKNLKRFFTEHRLSAGLSAGKYTAMLQKKIREQQESKFKGPQR